MADSIFDIDLWADCDFGHSTLDKLGKLTEEINHRPPIDLEANIAKLERAVALRDSVSKIFFSIAGADVYEYVLKFALVATSSRYGVFGYIDDEENWICPSLTGDVWSECDIEDKTFIFPKEQWTAMPTWGRVYTERKSLVVNHPLSVPEGHIPIQRFLVSPVFHLEHFIGLIGVANKVSDYDEDDESILNLIAYHVGPVLHDKLLKEST